MQLCLLQLKCCGGLWTLKAHTEDCSHREYKTEDCKTIKKKKIMALMLS